MNYREVFVPNYGYRLVRDGISITLRACSWNKSSQLSNEQMMEYTAAMDEYLRSVAYEGTGRAFPDVNYDDKAPLTLMRESTVGPFYKYVSEETVDRLLSGYFQFGTAKYYRETENAQIQDIREGLSTIHIDHGGFQLHLSIIAGYHCAIFCGTSPLADSQIMTGRFGAKLIAIDDVTGFMSTVRRSLKCISAFMQDVQYFEPKSFYIKHPAVTEVIDILTKKPDAFGRLNKKLHLPLRNIALAPSIFLKPKYFEPERERRMIFQLRKDITTDLVKINDRKLADFVRVVNLDAAN